MSPPHLDMSCKIDPRFENLQNRLSHRYDKQILASVMGILEVRLLKDGFVQSYQSDRC